MVSQARFCVVLTLWLGSCGPSIGVVEGEPDTTGGDGSPGTTTTMPEPMTSGPATSAGPSTDDSVGSSGAVDDASTGDGRDDGGCGFLCAPDVDASGECDLFAQNCPPGDKCMPWADDGGPAWNATHCSPLAKDPAQVGEPCMVEGSAVSGIDDCDVGLMCWNVDENAVGVCEDICTGSVDDPICENPEDVCMISNDGALALCMTACHPLLQDCEIENEVCYPDQDDWGCAPDCSCGGNGVYGDPCDFASACDQGNVCIGTAAFTSCEGLSGCCSMLCDLNDDAADAFCQSLDPAQTCEPWYAEGQAPFGYDDVGVCMIAGSP